MDQAKENAAAVLCLVQIILLAYGAKYLAALIPVTLAVVYFLQRFYLFTSQQLSILDLELKSPVYSALTETLDGLATIRAFGWQSAKEQKYQALVDDSQRAVYLMYMIQRWLNFALDVILAALATLLVTFATQFSSTTTGATFGVGWLSILGFSQNLSQFTFFYTELENFLGATTRLREYVEDVEQEDRTVDKIAPANDWPRQGKLEFRNVSAAYKSVSQEKQICW